MQHKSERGGPGKKINSLCNVVADFIFAQSMQLDINLRFLSHLGKKIDICAVSVAETEGCRSWCNPALGKSGAKQGAKQEPGLIVVLMP